MQTESITDLSRRFSPNVDSRLAAYVAATGAAATCASDARAVVVGSSAEMPFGVNGDVNIDFNSDGQIDFQIDHDRVDLNGTLLDYLQIDKNDVNGAADPLPVDGFATFPLNDTDPNSDHGYLAQETGFGDDLGAYPRALQAGEMIGGDSIGVWDWQEGDNFNAGGTYIRANRLIDEDAGQIDVDAGNPVTVPVGTPAWLGLGGEVRYLGVRIDFNDAAFPEFNESDDQYWYGWIGIRIDNEADATGAVVGYAYETELGMPIMAGDTGPVLSGDYNGDGAVDAADYTVWRDTLGSTTDLRADGDNSLTIDQPDYGVWQTAFGAPGSGSAAAVPEPGSSLLAVIGGTAVLAAYLVHKWFS